MNFIKRLLWKTPSPSPPTFPDISNDKADTYNRLSDKVAPAVPTIEYRTLSRTYFDEFSRYLTEYLAKSPPNARGNARQKLTRLTKQQFHELSTDVYDELLRRQNDGSPPFLPVRDEFHPKRNQARQKLASLPTSRFEDLSSDIHFELARRNPEFKEDMRIDSTAPSPTSTAFTGISKYKTDSYRPIWDQAASAVPTIDYRTVSRTHFDELSRYLTEYLAKSPPNARASSRQKLTRLTIQQFHELSTDVYDELLRRQNEGSPPFLPVRYDFHPKRNQARQKLASLPASRFQDLSSDVHFELARRNPEFKEDMRTESTPPSPTSTAFSGISNFKDR